MAVIALTPSWDNENRRMVVVHDYIQGVLDAGGVPVVIPPIQDKEKLIEALDRCDGLLLTGGDDVNPACYGEEMLPCCGLPSRSWYTAPSNAAYPFWVSAAASRS